MAIKAIIDATLLANCQRLGKVRYGMLRVAEEITKRLVHDEDLEVYFSHPLKNSYENQLLNSYLETFKESRRKNISYPFSSSTLSILERTSARVSKFVLADGGIPFLGRYDVFHSFYTPFPSKIRASKISKSITLLDIIPLRVEGYRELIPELEMIVDCIVPNFTIAISEFSKADLCDYDKRVDPSRVFVVPLAANRELFFVNRSRAAWLAVKEKYALPDNYFLSVSATDKRKNLEHLVRSFEKFVLQERPGDLKLVLTGNATFGHLSLRHLNLSAATLERIVFVKPIEDEDLNVVYSNAVCFFFMSLYEGFGLPPLEAMQCGLPVVTSNATSIPEVVGDAGILIDPTDVDLLCQKMLEIYSDSALRQRLSVAGIERAKAFSWEHCAKQYVSIFKAIAN